MLDSASKADRQYRMQQHDTNQRLAMAQEAQQVAEEAKPKAERETLSLRAGMTLEIQAENDKHNQD